MITVRCDGERLARAELTYLAAAGDLLLGGLVRASSAAEAMTLIRGGQLTQDAGSAATCGAQRAMNRWHAALQKVPSRGEIEEALGRPGIRLVCPGDAEWPGQLADLEDAQPYALWLRGAGDLRFSCKRSIAITGSRAATAYGAYVAGEMAASVAGRGWAVASGCAFGVDASALRGALGAGGVTVAVLACGVEVPYPAAHADLLDAVAVQGVIVSEQPPGALVSRLRFLSRNRIVAALATSTLVVEAAQRSGSMTAASNALSLGRPVMAVPGPITSDLSAGCNTLIRQRRATAVTSASEVIETITAAGSPTTG